MLQHLTLREQSAFTAADDIDPNTPGLQVRIVVEVNDVANGRELPVVHLMDARGVVHTTRTQQDGHRRVAIFDAVGVASDDDGLANDWLVYVDDEATDVSDDDDTPLAEGSVLQNVVRGVSDVGFPFACTKVAFVDDMLGLSQVNPSHCSVLRGDFIITDSDDASLPHVPTLVDIQGDVIIEDNDQLHDLSALQGVERVQGDVSICNNPQLTLREVDAWMHAVGTDNIGGAVIVDDNG